MESEVSMFVQTYLHFEALDIEKARRIIVEHLAGLPPDQDAKTDEWGGLTTVVQQRLFAEPVNPPAGVIKFNRELNKVKAQLVAREALQTLQAMGVIISCGGLSSNNDDRFALAYDVERYRGQPTGIDICLPSAFYSYRLAAAFRDSNSRLISGSNYLSGVDTTHLPSRAKRCMDESMNAFKHGLYLSAVLNVGAASENIWMDLARLVDQIATNQKLRNALSAKRTDISTVMDETWQSLMSHCTNELDSVFPVPSQRSVFKDHADRLRGHRNYAAHVEDAAIDEHYFTYEETGMLLLEATPYFDQLIRLHALFAARP